MTRSSQKDLERTHVEAFINLLPLCGVNRIDDSTSERPDVRIYLDDGRGVGVEVVRAINPSVASGAGVIRRLRSQITAGLKARGVPAFVALSIPSSLAGAMNDRRDIVEANVARIVDLACDACPAAIGEWKTFGADSSDAPGSLESIGIHWINRIHVTRAEGEPVVTVSGTGQMESPDLVQSLIDEKSALLPGYARDVAEHWLLVVGSERTGGSFYVEQVEERPFRSAFARTFFLELFEGKCVELKTTCW